MKRIFAALLLVVALSSFASAKTVFMKNEEEIAAQSAWKVKDTVYVKVNRDVLLTFPSSEVDLKKSKLLSSSRPTTAVRTASKDVISQVMELSGVSRSIENFPLAIEMGARAARPNANETTDGGILLAKAVADHFDLDAAQAAARKYYAQYADRSTLEETHRWLETPVAQKIVAAEVASELAGNDEVSSYLAAVQKNSDFKQRLDLVKQIDRESQCSEEAVRVEMLTVRCLLDALPIPAQAREQMKKQQMALIQENKEKLRKKYLSKLAYTYRTLSDAELQEYVSFLKTNSGRKFNKVTMGALEQTIQQLFATFKKAKPLREG